MRVLEIPLGRFRWLRRLIVGAALVQLLGATAASASGRLPAVLAADAAISRGNGLEVRPVSITYSLTGSLVGKATHSGPSGRLHWRTLDLTFGGGGFN